MGREMPVFGRVIAAGTHEAFRAPVGELNDGTELTVPVIVIHGEHEGPVVLLSGAVHGDEYLGPIAIQQLMARTKHEEIAGTLIGIPIMGPLAFLSRSRSSQLDYEHFNLNRLWPGDHTAFLTQRIAHLVFEQVVRQADYVLDYHEGGVALMARYLLLGGSEATIKRVGQRQLELARWFGMGIPIAYRQTTEDTVRVGKLGNLTEAVGQIGIPAISVEIGGGGMYRPELLDIVIAGTRRVLQGVGLLPGGPPELDPSQVVVRETTWLRPARGGFVLPTSDAVLGARISKGTVIARVVEPLGEIVDELVAPHDGVILDVRILASVFPGDWAYHLAKL